MKKYKLLMLIGILPFMFTSCTNNNVEGQNTFQNSQEIIQEEQISNSSIIEEIIDSEDVIEEENKDNIEDNEIVSNEDNKVDKPLEEETYYHFKEDISIYINPSVQYENLYANNLGNEGYYMNQISIILTKLLKENTNIDVYSNNDMPGKSLSKSVRESNSLDVDYHLALHSNAGGGVGSEGWYTKSSYKFTKSIIDSLQDVLPYKTRGLKDGQKTLYELKATDSSASLIEILFHDDANQALFIINNQEEIAYAIYEGIISYFI